MSGVAHIASTTNDTALAVTSPKASQSHTPRRAVMHRLPILQPQEGRPLWERVEEMLKKLEMKDKNKYIARLGEVIKLLGEKNKQLKEENKQLKKERWGPRCLILFLTFEFERIISRLQGKALKNNKKVTQNPREEIWTKPIVNDENRAILEASIALLGIKNERLKTENEQLKERFKIVKEIWKEKELLIFVCLFLGNLLLGNKTDKAV